MIHNQPVKQKEIPYRFCFFLDRNLPAGTLLRIKPTDFKATMKAFAVHDIRLGDGPELAITFTSNDVNWDDVSNWSLHGKMRALAEFILPRDAAPGDQVSFTLEMLAGAPARAGMYYDFELEAPASHDEITGPICAADTERMLYVPREPHHIEAYLKVDGRLLVQTFDEFNNPVPSDATELTLRYNDRTETVPIHAETDDSITLTLPTTELTRVTVQDDKGRSAVSNYYPRVFGKNIYFGEFHWHTEFSDGSRPLVNALRIARDNMGLDFAGSGDHIWRNGHYSTPKFTIAEQIRIFEDFKAQSNGHFATIYGAEANGCRGHVNIYARSGKEFEKTMTAEPDKIKTVGEHPNVWPLRQLNDELESEGDRNAMLIPHHTNVDSTPYVNKDGLPAWGAFPWPGNGESYGRVRLIEIVQGAGSFETEDYQEGWRMTKKSGTLGGAARTALIKGFKVGFCGCSDDHNGVPTGKIGNRAVGMTGVLADELNDEQIFDNMYDRHCYATSGAMIVAAARMNGQLMGSQLYQTPGAERRIDIEIHGTAPIELIEIIHAGITLASLPVDGSADFIGSWTDTRPGRPFNEAWYYVRARQTDGECLWLSPFFIDLPKELI